MLHRVMQTGLYPTLKFHPQRITGARIFRPAPGFGIEHTKDGALRIGGSRERAGFDRGNSFECIEAVREKARVYIPAAADLHFARCFPALRPHTPGGFPARGRVKGAPGLVIRGGREGGGIAPAPIPAKRAAEDTACGKTGLPIGPCPVEGFYNERRV